MEAGSVTDDQRRVALAERVGLLTREGWRVETQADYQATMVKGRRPNHILHLLLSIVTVGLWLFVWIGLAIFGGERRMVLTVDADGQVRGA